MVSAEDEPKKDKKKKKKKLKKKKSSVHLPALLRDDERDSSSDENEPFNTGCVNPGTETFYYFGDVWRDFDTCNRKTCFKDGSVQEEICAPIPEPTIESHCFILDAGLSLPYDFPYCCPKLVCPGDSDYRTGDEDLHHTCEDTYGQREVHETWTDKNRCVRKTCKKFDRVIEEKCPKPKVPRGCWKTQHDVDKEFPDCCPVVVCPKKKECKHKDKKHKCKKHRIRDPDLDRDYVPETPKESKTSVKKDSPEPDKIVQENSAVELLKSTTINNSHKEEINISKEQKDSKRENAHNKQKKQKQTKRDKGISPVVNTKKKINSDNVKIES